jgi:hypothetical protein
VDFEKAQFAGTENQERQLMVSAVISMLPAGNALLAGDEPRARV